MPSLISYGALFAIIATLAACAPAKPPSSDNDKGLHKVLYGAYTTDPEGYVEKSNHTLAIRSEFLKITAGGWDENSLNTMTDLCNNLKEAGTMPMLTIEPNEPVENISEDVFNQIGNDIRTQCPTSILRFGHEMNGNWYPNWSGKGQRYIDAYCKMANAVKDSTTIRMLWAPNVEWEYMANDYKDFWPGDDCNVHIVGLSFYQKPSKEHEYITTDFIGRIDGSANDVTGNNFYEEYSEAKGLPFMIAETAATFYKYDGDKVNELEWKLEWAKQVYSTAALEAFPRLRAIVWFDTDNLADSQESNGIFDHDENFYGAIKREVLDASWSSFLIDASGVKSHQYWLQNHGNHDDDDN